MVVIELDHLREKLNARGLSCYFGWLLPEPVATLPLTRSLRAYFCDGTLP